MFAEVGNINQNLVSVFKIVDVSVSDFLKKVNSIIIVLWIY